MACFALKHSHEALVSLELPLGGESVWSKGWDNIHVDITVHIDLNSLGSDAQANYW